MTGHPLHESAGALLASLFAFGGWALLAFAMDRHAPSPGRRSHRPSREVRGPSPFARILLRGGGAILLTASILPCLSAWGLTIGWVAWFGVLTASGYGVTLLLQYAPRLIRVLAVACIFAGIGIAAVVWAPRLL